MNDKEFLKSIIIGLEAKYVNEVEDAIKFTYEDRNYTLYINRDYNLSTCTNVAVPGASWTYNSTTSTSRIINQYKNNTQNWQWLHTVFE